MVQYLEILKRVQMNLPKRLLLQLNNKIDLTIEIAKHISLSIRGTFYTWKV